jgi:thiosulfate reductase cytochrome b subunit
MTDEAIDAAVGEVEEPRADRHADRPLPGGRIDTWRHPLTVRLTHWLNVLAMTILVMSGINILMAHPHLYWGNSSTFDSPWMSFALAPDWLMVPQQRNLGAARDWHFLFAWIFVINGLIYLAFITISGRLKRVIGPTRAELADIPHSVVEHAQLKFPKGEEARRYNVLQKLTYLLVLLVLLPMMLATGLAMSPTMNAALPELLWVLGGRQSARTLHFLSASGLIGFVLVHVVLVFVAGFTNNMRSMITGWFVIEPEPQTEKDDAE